MRSAGGILEVIVSRGMCYGPCPVYRCTVRRDGTATWFGDAFVSSFGFDDGVFEPAQFEALAASIERSGFFTGDAEYPPLATCSSARAITVRTSDGDWTVEGDDSNPEPRGFGSIVRRVERIAERIGWLPRESEAHQI